MENSTNAHPFTLANNYAHFTMLANFWYAKNPTNSTGVFYQRGLFYDRLACACTAGFNREQMEVANHLYAIKRNSGHVGNKLYDSFQVNLNVA